MRNKRKKIRYLSIYSPIYSPYLCIVQFISTIIFTVYIGLTLPRKYLLCPVPLKKEVTC